MKKTITKSRKTSKKTEKTAQKFVKKKLDMAPTSQSLLTEKRSARTNTAETDNALSANKKMKTTQHDSKTTVRKEPQSNPLAGLTAQEQFGLLKNFLLEQKSNILNKSKELDSSSLSTDQGGVQDEADVASHQLTLNLTLNLHDRDRQSLAQIEKALAKLQSGRYGRCERCSADIGIRRLYARPFASLCIDCMQDQEEFSQPISPS